MISAVIDTNVLVSALRTRNINSPTIRIYYAILHGEIQILHSPDILAEYDDVLHRDKFSFDRILVDEILDFIKTRGRNLPPTKPDTETFPDPDDKIFYCVALAAQDEGAVLVTGNVRHFPSSPFVITPAECAALLENT